MTQWRLVGSAIDSTLAEVDRVIAHIDSAVSMDRIHAVVDDVARAVPSAVHLSETAREVLSGLSADVRAHAFNLASASAAVSSARTCYDDAQRDMTMAVVDATAVTDSIEGRLR